MYMYSKIEEGRIYIDPHRAESPFYMHKLTLTMRNTRRTKSPTALNSRVCLRLNSPFTIASFAQKSLCEGTFSTLKARIFFARDEKEQLFCVLARQLSTVM